MVKIEIVIKQRKFQKLEQLFVTPNIVMKGFWYSPEADFLRSIVDTSQQNVEGVVTLSVFKGNVYIKGRESAKSLYNKTLVR